MSKKHKLNTSVAVSKINTYILVRKYICMCMCISSHIRMQFIPESINAYNGLYSTTHIHSYRVDSWFGCMHTNGVFPRFSFSFVC